MKLFHTAVLSNFLYSDQGLQCFFQMIVLWILKYSALVCKYSISHLQLKPFCGCFGIQLIGSCSKPLFCSTYSVVFNSSTTWTFLLLTVYDGVLLTIFILQLQDGQDDAKQSTADMTAFVSSLVWTKIYGWFVSYFHSLKMLISQVLNSVIGFWLVGSMNLIVIFASLLLLSFLYANGEWVFACFSYMEHVTRLMAIFQ